MPKPGGRKPTAGKRPGRGKAVARKRQPKRRRRIVRVPLPGDLERRLRLQFRRFLAEEVRVTEPVAPAAACDINALCRYMTLLAPPGPGAPEEAVLTTIVNSINRLKAAVAAIESFLFDETIQTVVPGYAPYFLNVGPGDPPEKGGTPPPPAFPPA